MLQVIQFYFDTESFARDMVLNGDTIELSFEDTSYITGGR